MCRLRAKNLPGTRRPRMRCLREGFSPNLRAKWKLFWVRSQPGDGKSGPGRVGIQRCSGISESARPEAKNDGGFCNRLLWARVPHAASTWQSVLVCGPHRSCHHRGRNASDVDDCALSQMQRAFQCVEYSLRMQRMRHFIALNRKLRASEPHQRSSKIPNHWQAADACSSPATSRPTTPRRFQ
jgi:hypothetical protein